MYVCVVCGCVCVGLHHQCKNSAHWLSCVATVADRASSPFMSMGNGKVGISGKPETFERFCILATESLSGRSQRAAPRLAATKTVGGVGCQSFKTEDVKCNTRLSQFQRNCIVVKPGRGW